MDPATFTLIVTALSGVSATLGIGQIGFQFFRNKKQMKAVVNEENQQRSIVTVDTPVVLMKFLIVGQLTHLTYRPPFCIFQPIPFKSQIH